MIEYVQLGQTDLRVSRIGFGAEPLGGTDWGRIDESGVKSAVSRALELGVNLFDTADVYGLGRSESLLSEALGVRRRDVVIATKFGVNWVQDPHGGRARTFFDSRPYRVMEALEASLRRLRIDTIPLYFIHWPDPSMLLEYTLEILAKCQKSGKIRHVGLCNFSSQQIQEAHRILSITAVQISYSLLDRRAEEELLKQCWNLGISVIAYGPLSQGLLTGKYNRYSQFGEDDRRHRLQHFSAENINHALIVVDKLRQVSTQYNRTPAQTALRWVLDNPMVGCALTGVKSPDQIENNVGALGWTLSHHDYHYLADSALKHKGAENYFRGD